MTVTAISELLHQLVQHLATTETVKAELHTAVDECFGTKPDVPAEEQDERDARIAELETQLAVLQDGGQTEPAKPASRGKTV